MTTEAILGILTVLSGIVIAWLAYKQRLEEKKTELLQRQESVQDEFTTGLIKRIDALETRVDDLTERLIETAKKAEDDRDALAQKYEGRIESLQKEMRRLLDEATVEVSVWRDRYFKVMEEYQQLKIDHNELIIKYKNLEALYIQLQEVYKVRTSPDLSATA